MALALLNRILKKRPRKHFDVGMVPTLASFAAAAILLLGIAGIAWFAYANVYTPYTVDTIPEDRITQKQEKLNVVDFETVSSQLQAKQEDRPAAESPF